MEFLSGILGAGANLLGGLLGRSSAEKVAQQNIQAQEDFAQHGISWRVADARAAGINPLAALGASTSSFSNIAGDNSLGAGVAAAGQDVSRAAAANSARVVRQADLEQKLIEAKIANVNADTTQIMANASRLARTYASPGSPTGISYVPMPRPAPWTANTQPGEQRYRLDDGSVVIAPSQELSNATQTLAAGGVNLGLAPYFAKRNLVNSGEIERAPVGSGPVTVRPDVWRGVNDYHAFVY